MRCAVPEARVTGLAETADGAIRPDDAPELEDPIAQSDVVLIGPGMVQPELSGELLLRVVPMLSRSTLLVIDAAALPILRKCDDRLVPGDRTLLLPNPGEMADLLGRDLEDIQSDPLAALRAAVERFGCAIALRGGETLIGGPASPVFVDRSGHPARQLGFGRCALRRRRRACGAVVTGHGAAVGRARSRAAGSELAEHYGGIGLLARELPERLPSILNGARQEQQER